MTLLIREYNDDHDWHTLCYGLGLLQEYLVELDPQRWTIKLPGYTELQAKVMLNLVRQRSGAIFIAERHGSFAGLVTGYVVPEDAINASGSLFKKFGVVSDIVVTATCRDQGVGRMLLERMEDHLRERGCDAFWLTVKAFNGNASGFYEHLGYAPMDVRYCKPA